MLLNYKMDYPESLDYTALQGFNSLDESKKKTVREAYEQAYRISAHLGNKIAAGKAFETAKLALVEAMKPVPPKESRISQSIFYGLANCE
jgi:hypothetical protein